MKSKLTFLIFLWNIAVFVEKRFISADYYFIFNSCVLLFFNQNTVTSPPFWSDTSSLIMWAGQPVTHMISTNSKPQTINRFPMDKIKFWETH